MVLFVGGIPWAFGLDEGTQGRGKGRPFHAGEISRKTFCWLAARSSAREADPAERPAADPGASLGDSATLATTIRPDVVDQARQKRLEFLKRVSDKDLRQGGPRERFITPSPLDLVGSPSLTRSRGIPRGAGMHDLIEQYLCIYKSRLKPSTFQDYRSILRHHLSHFSDLEALNMGLEEYLCSLEVSGKRRNNILTAAKSFIGWARRRRLWSGDLLEIPRFKSRSKKIKPLSAEETQLIMSYAPRPYRDYFHFALLTGVRTGEALGLRFEDFDLAGKVIMIRRALTCGEIVTTKTMAGEREFPLLRPLREIYQLRAAENETGSPWFFYSVREGHVMSRKALTRAWKGLLEAFKISPRPLYATRHTWASLAISAGEDPLWVAQAMGHSRPDQLFLKYSSFLEGMKRDGEKVSSMVMGRRKTFLRALP